MDLATQTALPVAAVVEGLPRIKVVMEALGRSGIPRTAPALVAAVVVVFSALEEPVALEDSTAAAAVREGSARPPQASAALALKESWLSPTRHLVVVLHQHGTGS